MSEAQRTKKLLFGRYTGEISLVVVTITYLIAVAQRSSLGVAAIEASSRFDVNAATLSSLGVVQLAVYAAMQVPVGVFLDRYGAKNSLVLGAVVMFVGQAIVAFSGEFGIAVAGRMLVGFGDAFTFIALIRIVNSWFSGTRASLFQQLAANVGQLGQVLSAIPFHSLLQQIGWTPAFSLLASLSLFAGLISIGFASEGVVHQKGASLTQALEHVRTNLRDPATRVGFWVHFTLQSSGSSFILLWGFPFLVRAEGLSPEQASLILTSFVFVGFLVGPVFGTVGGRFPNRRSNLVIAAAIFILAAWSFLILSPSSLPFWALLIVVLVIASGGPASMMAFDYSRRFIPMNRIGSANGIINMGGFIAAFSLMFLVGIGLDASLGLHLTAESYSLSAFRFAFIAEIAVTAFGLVCFLGARSKLRLELRANKGIYIRPLSVALAERARSLFR